MDARILPLVRTAAVSALVAALLVAGCGGDGGGQASQDPPAKTLEVSSGGEYERTAVPLAEKVISVREELPELGDFGDAKFAQRATQLADKVKRSSDRLAPVTPPAEILSEHQFLTDAVTIVEFDLRDVAAAESRSLAKEALDQALADLQRLDELTKTIKSKLG